MKGKKGCKPKSTKAGNTDYLVVPPKQPSSNRKDLVQDTIEGMSPTYLNTPTGFRKIVGTSESQVTETPAGPRGRAKRRYY
jgi:hypothetical protein